MTIDELEVAKKRETTAAGAAGIDVADQSSIQYEVSRSIFLHDFLIKINFEFFDKRSN